LRNVPGGIYLKPSAVKRKAVGRTPVWKKTCDAQNSLRGKPGWKKSEGSWDILKIMHQPSMVETPKIHILKWHPLNAKM